MITPVPINQISSISEKDMKTIVAEISARDKKMARVIAEHPLCTIGRNPKPVPHFESLVESVISQQLAVKAAETIFLRVKKAAGGRIIPTRIAALGDNQMSEAGVSGAKIKAIQGLASAAINREISFNKLHEIESDEEIFSRLTGLWGIGPWTVDMFMMFQLGRLDIWPTGDLGVRRGWEKIYSLPEEITPKALQLKGEKFRPYRSVVAWYCWRALN